MRILSGYVGDGRVLNLGSGQTGSGWRPGTHPVNVDLGMVERPSTPFIRADAQELPFRSDAFHGAVAKDVLEHVDDVHRAMSEIRRTLRPRARLVVTVPRAISRAVWADPTHRRGFTKGAIVSLLSDHGFCLQLLRRIGSVPGAGRLGIEAQLVAILRVPVVGHRFGTNWLAVAVAT